MRRSFSGALVLDRDRPFNRSPKRKTGIVQMWEQLTPADIERVKHRMVASRGEILKRHAEELQALDAKESEIATFERLVVAFANEHLSSAASSSVPVIATEKEAPAAILINNDSSEEMRQDAPSPLQVIHQPSPNFAIAPRLRKFGP
jgi:hypothetical protein